MFYRVCLCVSQMHRLSYEIILYWCKWIWLPTTLYVNSGNMSKLTEISKTSNEIGRNDVWIANTNNRKTVRVWFNILTHSGRAIVRAGDTVFFECTLKAICCSPHQMKFLVSLMISRVLPSIWYWCWLQPLDFYPSLMLRKYFLYGLFAFFISFSSILSHSDGAHLFNSFHFSSLYFPLKEIFILFLLHLTGKWRRKCI